MTGRCVARPCTTCCPTAHDMVREHTVLTAVAPAGVPVPRPSRCAPTRRSTSARSTSWSSSRATSFATPRPPQDELDARRARPASGPTSPRHSHSCTPWTPTTSASATLARHDGYIERQVRRWRGQYEQMQRRGHRPGRRSSKRSATALAARIPPQQRVSVVHGDYRLDNTVLDDDGAVRAILDWEICTLGDPLADIGLLCVLLGRPRRRPGRARRPGPDDRAGLRDERPGPQGLHGGERPRHAPTSPTSWPSATGSSRASSRASTPATPRAPRPATPARSTLPCPRGRARRERPRPARVALVTPDRRTTSSSSTSRAVRAGAGRRVRGLDRRGVRRGDGHLHAARASPTRR